MKLKLWLVGLGLATVLLMAVTAVWMYTQPYAFHGSVIEPPARAADFTLTTHDGKPYRLSDQTGKAIVMFFGYTSCPDVCPTALYNFKKIRAQLTHQADQTRFVFITVDPERDTMERMGAYVTNFDPSFVGLTGKLNELEAVWKSYGVYRAKREGGTALGYLMDHSSRIYVVDPLGNLRITYTDDTQPDDIARDIRHLLEQSPRASTTDHDESGDAPANMTMHGDLKIEKAWMRPATIGGTIGAFVSITNAGKQTDALIETSSPVARFGEIHETLKDGDVMRMQRTFRIEIPAGQKLELKPGGYHIMFITLTRDVKAGETIPVDLVFERAGKVTVSAEVMAR